MDERIWTDRPLQVGAQMDVAGCRVTRAPFGVQTLISGDLTAALERLAPAAPLLGFGQAPDGPDFALRIGRDQALLVTAEPVPVAAGWHGAGFAVSPAGAAYAPLCLRGAGAADLLAHGLNSAPPWASPSAATLFCGHPALVSGVPDGLVLWVEQGALTAVRTFLSACAP